MAILTKTKTVDSILSSFTKGLKELADLVKTETTTAQAEKDQADNLLDSAYRREAEVQRANAVIANLNSLLASPVQGSKSLPVD